MPVKLEGVYFGITSECRNWIVAADSYNIWSCTTEVVASIENVLS